MAKLLKLRRGTTSQHSSFTGAEGEVTVDTDKETLVVHDGSTAGGHPVAAEDMANVSAADIKGRLGTTLTNAEINASAAIAGTKISPDFGSQNVVTTGTITSGDVTITDTNPKLVFTDTDSNPDFSIFASQGEFQVYDETSTTTRFKVNSDGHTDVFGNLDVSAGIDVTGNITVSGTVDGRDVATDGTKLDGIEASATADQTAAEVRTLVGSASDSNVFTDADHAKLDALTTSNGVILNGVTATTQSASDNSTKVATTAYTDTAVSNLVDSSPGALNTLNELAAAINDDANFSTTVTNNIATKMPLAGGEFTGDVTCENITPDADSSRSLGTNSVRFANIYGDTLYGDGSNLTGITAFVSGMIILWSGAVNAIPSGWILCDGNNSTPNLQDRFVIGAGNSYSVGATGGATTDSVSISVSISGNTGNVNSYGNGSGQPGGNNGGPHTHSFSGSGSGSATVDTVPPYYALAYIMKT